MSNNDVETGKLNQLKLLMTSSDKGQLKSVPAEKLHQELVSILGQYKDGPLMITKMMEHLNDETISFEKVNNMVEFLLCYAL